MRITLVSSSLGGGGSERNIVWLGNALAAKGYRVTLVTVHADVPDFYRPLPELRRVRAPAEAARRCGSFGWRCVEKRIKVLRATLLETRPDVVISFVDSLNISVLMALAKSDAVPVIVAERVDPRYHRIGYRWSILRRFYYPRAAAVVVQTRAVSDWAQALWPSWKVTTIPNPVPTASVAGETRPEWFGSKNIVGMGRLVDQKGFDLLIDAFGSLAETFPDWHLTILGEGDERARLSDRAHAWAAGHRVHLVGAVSEPQSILAHADLFVLSSRFEGFPNALCEAMASGLAVISFDCPSGPGEIIRDRVNGFLVPAADVRALRERMAALMKDEGERRRVGEQASRICELFDEARILGHWEKLLRSVAGRTNEPDV